MASGKWGTVGTCAMRQLHSTSSASQLTAKPPSSIVFSTCCSRFVLLPSTEVTICCFLRGRRWSSRSPWAIACMQNQRNGDQKLHNVGRQSLTLRSNATLRTRASSKHSSQHSEMELQCIGTGLDVECVILETDLKSASDGNTFERSQEKVFGQTSDVDCIGTGTNVECVIPDSSGSVSSNKKVAARAATFVKSKAGVIDLTVDSSSKTTFFMNEDDMQEQGLTPFPLLKDTWEYLVLISPFFFWGTAMVAMKGVLPKAGPLFVAATRLIPSGFLLIAFARFQGRKQPSSLSAWLSIALFALVDASCFQCVKYDRGKAYGLLQPLPIPTAPWESIAMDFIFGLPKTSSGNEDIWTIVDRFSKQTHFIPVRKQITAEEMAKIFLVSVFKYHEMPRSIVSDRDSRRTGLFWRALWQNLHSTLRFSSSYHPQTDGQSEIVNSAFAYNNTIHSSTGKAPFEIVEGARKSPPMVKVMDDVFEAYKFVEDLDLAYQQVQQVIQKAQEKQKKAADKHRRRLYFREGDWVLLRFEKARLRKQKDKEKFYLKLRMRYYGPFQISEVINDVSCRLSLPASWKIHNAFHVSLLRQFVGELPIQPEDSPQPEVDELDEVLQPEQILAHKERRQGGRMVRRYLVKFKNYSAMDSKWMEEADLADTPQILELYLEAFSL
ncbi:hypothetical protein L7F22_035382 [Adiantum nelumboides]|nr:hypothetical protein [Adiantum nelumboides]